MREGWVETTLGEVARTRPPAGVAAPGIPYVALEHFDSGNPALHRWGDTADATSATTPFEAGDVLFGKLRPYLRKVVVAEFSGRCTNEALAYRVSSPALSQEYLALLLRSDAALSHASVTTGTRMPRTSARSMASMRVLLPPIEEQRRIVDLMSHMDAVTEGLAEESESVERMARSLRDEAFGAWSDQFEPAPAASLFGMLLGRQKSARQSVGSHVIPYIRSGNIADGVLRLDDVQEMNFEPDEQHKYAIRSGDVLLAEGGTVGQSALWKEEIQGPVGFDKHVIRLRPVEGMSTTNYIHQWCRWAFETGLFRETAKGVTISALGFGRAKALPVPKVPFEDQDGQTATLVAADALGQQLAAERSQLLQARAALLRELLSGPHQIPTSYDEFIRDEGAA